MLELDLDHFKVVNDTWGHPIGDIILRKTGEICNEMIRKSDVLVRMGGEEFIVLMPETDKEGAYQVAEKIRKALENFRHPIVGQFTVSIGVAQRMHSESFISWYKRLDDALYCAKSLGRNQVCVAKDLLHQTFTTIEFEWGPEWLSGHPIIDAQHKALLDIISHLISMTRSSLEFEKGMRELSYSLDLVIDHFLYEESVLASLGYPEAENHKAIHHNLIEQAQGFKASLDNEGFETQTFLSFMIDTVIIGHILKEDTVFFPFIRNQATQSDQA
jgi:diguanylate cyclase (GGDEF)-like protein/hemerythrin-like metal-binding protein